MTLTLRAGVICEIVALVSTSRSSMTPQDRTVIRGRSDAAEISLTGPSWQSNAQTMQPRHKAQPSLIAALHQVLIKTARYRR